MGKTTLEEQIQEKSTPKTSRKKDKVRGLVDATGNTLECADFTDKKIKISFGWPDYDNQELREEKSSSQFYQTCQKIKTKLTDFYHNSRLKLMNIVRYTPK